MFPYIVAVNPCPNRRKQGIWDTGLAEDFRHIIGASSQGHGLALHNHILAGNGQMGQSDGHVRHSGTDDQCLLQFYFLP